MERSVKEELLTAMFVFILGMLAGFAIFQKIFMTGDVYENIREEAYYYNSSSLDGE